MGRPLKACMEAERLLRTHAPIVCYDLETTGRAPKGGDRPIQFAAMLLTHRDGRYAPEDSLVTLIRPGFPLDPFITELTGITDGMLAGAPDEAAAFPLVKGFMDRGGIRLAYNGRFDDRFLREMYLRQGGAYGGAPSADAYELAKELVDRDDAGGHLTLADVARYYGCAPEVSHDAMADVRTTWRVFAREMADYLDRASGPAGAPALLTSMKRWRVSMRTDRLYVTLLQGGRNRRLYFDLWHRKFSDGGFDPTDVAAQMDGAAKGAGFRDYLHFEGSWKRPQARPGTA